MTPPALVPPDPQLLPWSLRGFVDSSSCRNPGPLRGLHLSCAVIKNSIKINYACSGRLESHSEAPFFTCQPDWLCQLVTHHMRNVVPVIRRNSFFVQCDSWFAFSDLFSVNCWDYFLLQHFMRQLFGYHHEHNYFLCLNIQTTTSDEKCNISTVLCIFILNKHLIF